MHGLPAQLTPEISFGRSAHGLPAQDWILGEFLFLPCFLRHRKTMCTAWQWDHGIFDRQLMDWDVEQAALRVNSPVRAANAPMMYSATMMCSLSHVYVTLLLDKHLFCRTRCFRHFRRHNLQLREHTGDETTTGRSDSRSQAARDTPLSQSRMHQ